MILLLLGSVCVRNYDDVKLSTCWFKRVINPVTACD